MGFLKTLIRPDHEEAPLRDQAVIANAANLLEVGEFQLLQLAYRAWHGTDMPDAMGDKLFASYMVDNRIPHWARHYARTVLERDRRGEINETSPEYHRYDRSYADTAPKSAKQFLFVVVTLMVVLGGGLIVAELSVDTPTSMLPPYFAENELSPAAGEPVVD